MSRSDPREANGAPGVSALTVTELTARIKQTLEQGFARVQVIGEVSRLTTPPSGHLYFTIKDAHAAISAVIWRSTLARLATRPEEGGEFVFSGHLSVYEPRGAYQLIVNRVTPAGIGRLAAEFERRKQAFAARGWFDPARKRTPPRLPRRIGIATSPNAAAFEDVRKVLATRPGWLELTLSPCLVQGAQAPASIAAALARLASLRPAPDVILLVRGGGSTEDLWCFNDERVVRAVVDCPVPVIAGIGHEIDTTLADLAADVRAATPSNAAEIACPSRAELKKAVPPPAQLGERLAARIHRLRERLRLPESRLRAAVTRGMDHRLHRSSQAAQALHHAMTRRLRDQRHALRTLQRRLAPLEPGARLRQRRQAWQRAHAGLRMSLPPQLLRRAQAVAHLRQRLEAAHQAQQTRRRHMLAQASLRWMRAAERQTPPQRRRLADARQRLHHAARTALARRRQALARVAGAIGAMNPERLLERGYALCLDANGRVVTRAASLHPGDALTARFADGVAESRIERIRLKP